MPVEDLRLNLNMAPAEQIAKRLPGVGYATAKKIVELRMSLSGERFANPATRKHPSRQLGTAD